VLGVLREEEKVQREGRLGSAPSLRDT